MPPKRLPPPSSDPDDGDGSRDGYSHRTATGSVRSLEELGIVEFYAINECLQQRCPIFLHCNHLKREQRCQIQIKYLNGINEMIVSQVNVHELTAIQRMKIGFHLQPLYRALCRLKMEELSLRRPTQITKSGSRVVHSVYKEIRETIKALTMVLRDLGLDDKKMKTKEKSFYDSLFEEEEKPQLTKRRGRK